MCSMEDSVVASQVPFFFRGSSHGRATAEWEAGGPAIEQKILHNDQKWWEDSWASV